MDLLVIGGGTAGLVASLIAAGAGARVVLAERSAAPGGDCLWTGCVPSKALIAAATRAHDMRTAPEVGIGAAEPRIDFAAVMEHVRGAQRRLARHDSAERLGREGVEVVQGSARFAGERTAEVSGRTFRFRRAFIATGSRPAVSPIPGIDEIDVLTNESVWDLRELPQRLVIIGGGPIGCELAQAFARLGSAVTLIEAGDRLLAKEESRAGSLVRERLESDGATVLVGAHVSSVCEGRLEVEGHGDVAFDRILVAAGRHPDSDALNLDAAGVGTHDGKVSVDGHLRTSNRAIYAGGDVIGALAFTHVAAYHARIAAINALFFTRRSVNHDAVPWVTFTDPEVARVGLSTQQARERWGERTTCVDFEYAELDRAVTAGRGHGFARLVGDRRGRLVGATIAAPAAGESIAELAVWVAKRGRIAEVSQAVHAYPTLGEGPARAADEHLRRRFQTPGVRRVTRPVLTALRLASR